MQIGFIGAGKMAEAILASMIKTEQCEPWEVVACDKDAARREYMEQQYGVIVTDDPLQVLKQAKVLILAVKPQDLGAVLEVIKPKLSGRYLLISIAAGKTLAKIQRAAGSTVRAIRVMPNLALMVQEGMSVYCAAKTTKPADRKLVANIFGGAGAVLELPEKYFDAVTALSGSGPAFVAYVAQALMEGGIALGLPEAAARLLTEQTLVGTGIYLQNTGSDMAGFIEAVTSPKGTTAAGMAVLKRSTVTKTLAKTLAAAANRSAELSS